MEVQRLTATEARVAGLVAGGHTNREIARELALSQRTLARHLADVYRKLGVSSRTEVAVLFGASATRGIEERTT